MSAGAWKTYENTVDALVQWGRAFKLKGREKAFMGAQVVSVDKDMRLIIRRAEAKGL
jgi:hypothetical protein